MIIVLKNIILTCSKNIYLVPIFKYFLYFVNMFPLLLFYLNRNQNLKALQSLVINLPTSMPYKIKLRSIIVLQFSAKLCSKNIYRQSRC